MNVESTGVTGRSSTAFKLRFAATLAVYGALLLILVPLRPFWLDEVMQLVGTWNTSTRALLNHVAENPGGVPLGYLFQHWSLSILGFGPFGARVVSVIAAVGSLALLIALCTRLELQWPVVAVAAWMLTPLVLRYALEGRPYMLSLLFALLCVLLQLDLENSRTAFRAGVLAASLTAALYSQPFAVFAPFGFAAASVWRRRDQQYLAYTVGAYAIAAILFVPWLIAVEPRWVRSIATNGVRFLMQPSLALLIVRELVGDGYIASVPLLILAVWSLIRSGHGRAVRVSLGVAVLTGIVIAGVADAILNYFFAIRQIVYILPFLILLSVDGAAHLWRRSKPAVAILMIFFAVGAIGKNFRYLADRNENWQRLSQVTFESADQGCILLPTGQFAQYYELFIPEFNTRVCGPGLAEHVVLPLNNYNDTEATRAARSELADRGFRRVQERSLGFSKLETYAKP